ncbi:PilZ domain-containing protein [Candidatus Poribacteria bacterium]|nr:PilZ domain-containing protein [Candidatus Poribacteria bacterium]
MSSTNAERRSKPRARGTKGLTVGAEPHVPAVQVKDISLSGVSFRTRQPIEFMTRLVMTLVFPEICGANRGAGAVARAQCEGAVVRCVPLYEGNGDRYEVAVFFTGMENSTREMLETYVRTH